jgi:hypothetical protein
MNFYVSTIPLMPPTGADMAARSQLLRERKVVYTCRETWVSGSGWLPILMAEKALSIVEMEVLELKAASTYQVQNAKEPFIL